MEQAATDGAPADKETIDQNGDQAKADGDGANTLGDRSAPDDEEDDHADQEGAPAESDCTFFVSSLVLACTGRRDALGGMLQIANQCLVHHRIFACYGGQARI